MSEATIEELVEKATSEEVFSFAEVVQGRSYPSEDVNIYLDEATAYRIAKIEEAIAVEADSDRVNKLEAEIISLREQLEKSKYVFKIAGIPTEVREGLLTKAYAEIPATYHHNKNFLTGGLEKVEKESPERDKLYTNLLWQAHVNQIIAPDGRVETSPSLAAIVAFRGAPLSQQQKLANAINKLVVAADAFEQVVDDDFLAKS